jgi:hypothetical protein
MTKLTRIYRRIVWGRHILDLLDQLDETIATCRRHVV